MKLEAEIASMTWKVKPEDLLWGGGGGARAIGGSRFSLPRGSVTSLESMASTGGKRQVYVKTCMFMGAVVAVKKINKAKIDLNRKLLLELKTMKDLHHDHLVRFIGACVEGPTPCLLTEYCPRGSLQDILEDEDIQLEWNFR